MHFIMLSIYFFFIKYTVDFWTRFLSGKTFSFEKIFISRYIRQPFYALILKLVHELFVENRGKKNRECYFFYAIQWNPQYNEKRVFYNKLKTYSYDAIQRQYLSFQIKFILNGRFSIQFILQTYFRCF